MTLKLNRSFDYNSRPPSPMARPATPTIVLPEPTKEDRLQGAILEALEWLRQGAPGRALEVLEKAIK